jgi:hypothetical protein
MMTAETIAEALGGRRFGTGWMARCPAHDDRRRQSADPLSRRLRTDAGDRGTTSTWLVVRNPHPFEAHILFPALSRKRVSLASLARTCVMAGSTADRRHDSRKISCETWSSPPVQKNGCNGSAVSSIMSLRPIAISMPIGTNARRSHKQAPGHTAHGAYRSR